MLNRIRDLIPCARQPCQESKEGGAGLGGFPMAPATQNQRKHGPFFYCPVLPQRGKMLLLAASLCYHQANKTTCKLLCIQGTRRQSRKLLLPSPAWHDPTPPGSRVHTQLCRAELTWQRQVRGFPSSNICPGAVITEITPARPILRGYKRALGLSHALLCPSPIALAASPWPAELLLSTSEAPNPFPLVTLESASCCSPCTSATSRPLAEFTCRSSSHRFVWISKDFFFKETFCILLA